MESKDSRGGEGSPPCPPLATWLELMDCLMFIFDIIYFVIDKEM